MRTFIAMPIPDSIRERLAEINRAQVNGLKWVGEDLNQEGYPEIGNLNS